MKPPLSRPLRQLASIPLFWVITIPLAVSALGSLAGAGYFAYRNNQVVVEDLGQDLVDKTHQIIHQELEDYLEMPLLMNQINAEAVDQYGLNVEDAAALEELLFDRLQQFDEVTGVMFASPTGRLRVMERFPDRRLVVAEPDQPNRVQVYELGPAGERGALVETVENFDVRRDRPWYGAAVERGALGWNPLFQQGTSDHLTLNASQPVYDANSKLLGVFAVHLRLDYVRAVLQSLEIGQVGHVILTDAEGRILATSTAEPPYRLEGGSGANKQFHSITLATSQDPFLRALDPVLWQEDLLLRATETAVPMVQFRYEDEVQYVSVARFQDSYGLDWRIITVAPESYFLGHLADHQRQAMLLWLLGVVSALGLGLVVAKLFLRRLGHYHGASQALAAGDLSQRLPTDSPIRELNGLAKAFNQMADQLQQSFRTIQTALDESEAKFTTIFRTSPVPMAIATLAEGRILEVNHSLLAVLGQSQKAMVGHRALDLHLWVDLTQRQRCRQLLTEQRRVQNLEVEVRTGTGEILTVLLSAEVQSLSGQDQVILTFHDITDRKRMELALKESEAQKRAILEALPDLIVRTRRDGTYLEIKPAATFPTALPHFVVGNNLRQVLPPDLLAPYLQTMERAFAKGETQCYEYAIEVQGEILWQEVRMVPMGSEEMLFVVRNLTDLHRMARALQESETRFRQLAETVQEGFFVYELDRQEYSYVNPAYWVVRGLEPTAAPDNMDQWLSGIHPEDRPRIDAALLRERRGENFDQEYRYFTPTGQMRWLRSKAFPLRDERGQVTRIVGTVENITERRLAEDALRQSEARFRRAFDHAPYGISLVSPTGQFVMANPKYCALLGYSEAELRQITFQDITHPDDLAADWDAFQRMMAGDASACQIEKRYLTKQGEAIPVIINTAPVYDASGHLLYSVGHVQDIRERLAIDRMKDEFISIVSHELRTPITSIQGALALLGAGVYKNRPEKAKTMLDIAINNSDRLVHLVDDILSFERLESGRVQLEPEPCQVEDLFAQALDSVQALAHQAHITLDSHPIPTTLQAAPDAIVQTLTNLLSNAIKFSAPGSTVCLRAATVHHIPIPIDQTPVETTTPPSTTLSPVPTIPKSPQSPHSPLPTPHSPPQSLLITVQDQGRGIPADKIESVFEQFQQVDASDSRQRGGTGLGLAICKRIVEQHRGRIWVESQLGQGSTFYVALPLTLAQEELRMTHKSQP